MTIFVKNDGFGAGKKYVFNSTGSDIQLFVSILYFESLMYYPLLTYFAFVIRQSFLAAPCNPNIPKGTLLIDYPL